MKASILGHLVEPLRDMVRNHEAVLDDFRRDTGAVLAATPCDALPAEIAAAFGLYILPVPVSTGARGACSSGHNIPSCYDCIISPAAPGDAGGPGIAGRAAVTFHYPAGYGEEASVALHAVMDEVLVKCTGKSVKELDVPRLQSEVELYDTLRRTVRGIAARRRERPGLLSCADLLTVFEAAAIFPPRLVLGGLSSLLDGFKDVSAGGVDGSVSLMLFSGAIESGELLDDIEECGFIVAEDDHCNGRRQFDISLNPQSDYIYYEILDAYTYRPLCPAMRSAGERFELLYRLLRNYDMETVLFLEDLCCGPRRKEMESLRVRLMRIGVDPLVATTGNVLEVLREYRSVAGESRS